MDREKILEDFEYAVRKSHGEGWDYVDGLTTEDGFKILELLKEQEHKDKMFHALEDDWKRLNELLKEQGDGLKHYFDGSVEP